MNQTSKTKAVDDYNADAIDDNEGLAHVYARPDMYIDSTNKAGLHHLLWEIVNNSVDEAIGDFCTEINVILNKDGSATVRDNGRGIPVDDKKLRNGTTIPVVQGTFTRIGFGGKFSSKAYRYSGGLHGVGSAVVNALSDYLNVEVRRYGQVHSIGFSFVDANDPGVCTSPLAVTGKTRRKSDTGTTVTFRPLTNGKFSTTTWDIELIATRLRFFAYAVAGLTITLTDKRTDDPETRTTQSFCFENGFADLIDDRAVQVGGYINADGEESYDILLDDDLSVEGPVLGPAKDDGSREEVGRVEVIAQWTGDKGSSVDGVVNAIPTPSGGPHVSGVQSAFVKAVNRAAKEMSLLSDKEKVKWDDISHGIVMVVSTLLHNPAFGGQTKSSLSRVAELDDTPLTAAFRNSVNHALAVWAEQHPVEMRDVAQRAVDKMQERRRAEAEAKEIMSASRGVAPSSTVPSKLRDSKKHGENAEALAVEGDSAGGGAEKTRNENYQAILPLMGKVDNMIVAIVSMHRKEAQRRKTEPDYVAPLPPGPVTDLVNALGAGTEGQFDPDKLRFGRFIIMTDADPDGRHITNLLIALFYILMPQMIYDGRLYEVRTPLYAGHWKDEVVFVTTEEEREDYERKHPGRKITWDRFKGLGQMNKDELYYHGLNPQTRVLKRITVSEAEKVAFGAILDATLGSTPQRKWDMLTDLNETDGVLPDWVSDMVDAPDDPEGTEDTDGADDPALMAV